MISRFRITTIWLWLISQRYRSEQDCISLCTFLPQWLPVKYLSSWYHPETSYIPYRGRSLIQNQKFIFTLTFLDKTLVKLYLELVCIWICRKKMKSWLAFIPQKHKRNRTINRITNPLLVRLYSLVLVVLSFSSVSKTVLTLHQHKLAFHP